MEGGTRSAAESLLVVGASSDIGGALLRRLDGSQLTVFATYSQSAAKLSALAGQMRTLEVVPIHADLAQIADVSSLIASVKARCGAPDKFVHLAAPKLRSIRFKDVSWNDFQMELDIQLRSITLLLKEFLPAMCKNKKGKIVFVLSSAAWNVPPVAMSHYVTAKFALKGLMKSLAAEYASYGLNINAVSPSAVDTAFWEMVPARRVEILASQSPRQRNATPDEVAGVIEFLLSPSADYMCGADIPVTGGSVF